MIDLETRLRADADAWRQQARADYPELDRLLARTQLRPCRRTYRTLAVAATVVAVAATAVVVVMSGGGGDQTPAASNAATTVPSVTLSGPGVSSPILIGDGELFEPLPAVPAGALTADEALAAETAHQRHAVKRVPLGVRATYGVLRLPSGKTRPVWGYSTGPLDCTMTGLKVPSPRPQCIEWDFVDAFTGVFVITDQQPV